MALSWVHLWIGLTVGTAFAVTGLAGTVLVFHTDLLIWQHPQLATHAPVADGAVLTGVLTRWTPQGLTAIDVPRETLPVWQAYFADGSRRYFAPDDGALLLSRHRDDDWLMWLHELHVELLGGEAGHQVLGVLGWICLGLLLTGLYLWWPKRGRVLAHLKLHRGPPVRRWLSWHRGIGVALLPLLLLLTLTGVGMVYHDGARALLTTVFGGATASPSPAPRPAARAPDWPRVLAQARAALPGAQLTRVSPPPAESDVIGFRARAPGEWHPNGRSLAFVDTTGTRLLLRHDARAQPLGARIDEAIYPLHIGAVGGPVYRWATALGGMLPAFLLTTGFLFWRRRRGNAERTNTVLNAASELSQPTTMARFPRQTGPEGAAG